MTIFMIDVIFTADFATGNYLLLTHTRLRVRFNSLSPHAGADACAIVRTVPCLILLHAGGHVTYSKKTEYIF
jgi:hypothetical protein